MALDITVFVPERSATVTHREVDVPADVSEGLETVYQMWTEDHARVASISFTTPDELREFVKQANYWAYHRPAGRVKFQKVKNSTNTDTSYVFRIRDLPTTLETAQNTVYNAKAKLRTAQNAGIATDILTAEAELEAAVFNLEALKSAA